MHSELAPLRAPGVIPRSPVSLSRAIPASPAMTRDLATDRRRRPPQQARDRSAGLPCRNPPGDLLPLNQRQRQPAAALLRRCDPAALLQRREDRARRAIQRPTDLADRLSPPPPLPQLSPLPSQIHPPRPRHRNSSRRSPNRAVSR